MATVNIYNMADTWNNVATTYTAIKMNVTDTNSASGSLLMDLQVGGTSAFNVSKGGSVKLGINSSGTNVAGTNVTISGSQGTGSGAGGSIIFQVAPAGGAGSAQNTLVDALTIGSNRSVTIAAGSATLKRGTTANYLIYENSGFDVFQVTGGEFNLVGNAILTWGNTNNTFTGYTADTILRRDAANTLALRNSTNAQTFRVYNTYTDASNYERGFVKWDTNVLKIGTEKLGTGTARALEFQTDGTTRLTINSTGIVSFAGNLLAIGQIQTNTYFLSAAAALNGNGGLYIGTASSSRAELQATGVGIMALGRWGTGDVQFQFGGTTSSFPALKRSSTTLQVRLADDSAFAPLESASVKTDAPAGGTSGTWKLGVAATVSPTSPNRTIEVDIGGTIYYIHAKTTND